MLVPAYWAEARVQGQVAKRPVTVRRFGWSDASSEDAQRSANERAQEAFDRIAAGVKLPRREPKVAYNGAQGVPIREEILSRHGEVVVTRNAYGAHCLNTPDVLFADVDFAEDMPPRLMAFACILLQALAAVWGWHERSWWLAIGGAFLGLIVALSLGPTVHRAWLRVRGGAEAIARKRLAVFLDTHRDWRVRLYRTPAGLRVMAVHRRFDPTEEAVEECFHALGVDRDYARMCVNQRCFRARVSPKPWRIGIESHMRPRPGVWPVDPERLPVRLRWIESYEQTMRDYASCRYIDSIGHGAVSDETRPVQVLHDEMSRAESALPIA